LNALLERDDPVIAASEILMIALKDFNMSGDWVDMSKPPHHSAGPRRCKNTFTHRQLRPCTPYADPHNPYDYNRIKGMTQRSLRRL